MMPAIKRAFDLLKADVVELSTEHESSKNKIGSSDEKWFEESKARLSTQFYVDKSAKLIMSRKLKQTKKQASPKGIYRLSLITEN